MRHGTARSSNSTTIQPSCRSSTCRTGFLPIDMISFGTTGRATRHLPKTITTSIHIRSWCGTSSTIPQGPTWRCTPSTIPTARPAWGPTAAISWAKPCWSASISPIERLRREGRSTQREEPVHSMSQSRRPAAVVSADGRLFGGGTEERRDLPVLRRPSVGTDRSYGGAGSVRPESPVRSPALIGDETMGNGPAERAGAKHPPALARPLLSRRDGVGLYRRRSPLFGSGIAARISGSDGSAARPLRVGEDERCGVVTAHLRSLVCGTRPDSSATGQLSGHGDLPSIRKQIWNDPLFAQAGAFYQPVPGDHQEMVQTAEGGGNPFRPEPAELAIEYGTSAGPASPPTSIPSPSLEDRLGQLKRLYEQGLITEDDYRTKKQQLLDRL